MTPTSEPIDARQFRSRRRRGFDALDAVSDPPPGQEAAAAVGLVGMRRLMRLGDDAARVRLLTGLQRTHGNRAVQRLLGPTGAPTLVQRRDPPNAGGPSNASVSPPNASVGSRAPVIHEGIALQPDMNALRSILERLIVERGAQEMHDWAIRFINMTPEQEGQRYRITSQPVDPALLEDIKVHLKEALLKLEYENKELLKTFEEKALAMTRELLDQSEKQIKQEQQRLGITSSQDANKEGVPQTVYSMSNAQAGKVIQDAARELAAKRKQLDTAREEMVKARKKLEADTASLALQAQGMDQRALQEATGTWRRLEQEYGDLRKRHETISPILAAYASGPDAANLLTTLANQQPKEVAQSLGHEAAVRLKNIETVRKELGGRFNVWKQAHLRAMVKQQLAVKPFQSRLIEEKAKAVVADDTLSKLLFDLISASIGLAQHAPGPIGALAQIAGAGMSIYSAYEKVEDYSLEAAASNMAFDKANAIAQGDKSFLWLAVEVAAAVADVVAAKGAFTRLKGMIQSAKAGRAAKLPEVVRAAEEAGLSGEAKGRFVAACVGAGGGSTQIVTKLEEVHRAYQGMVGRLKDEKLRRGFLDAADQLVKEKRVAVINGSFQEQKAAVRQFVASRVKDANKVEEETAHLMLELQGTAGIYDPKLDVVILRGNGPAEYVASTLSHELAHRQQELLLGLEELTKYEQEFQAFAAQREILRQMPAQEVPPGWDWLYNADNARIEQEVTLKYKVSKPPDNTNERLAKDILALLKQKTPKKP